ncbi:MAG: hypothetical protein HMLKMBBP_03152 [Planctomycetes bacterium]|nr:hypothetical protein [Planctomycetota bacterium]
MNGPASSARSASDSGRTTSAAAAPVARPCGLSARHSIPAARTESADVATADSTFAPPRKRATNAVAGAFQSSAGAPICATHPPSITATRSASASASS